MVCGRVCEDVCGGEVGAVNMCVVVQRTGVVEGLGVVNRVR